MISRLTASAALFAVITTATLSFAATSTQVRAPGPAAAAAAAPLPVVQLEPVVIVGRRAAQPQR